ncbi:hypothetical protein NECAME_19190, partial [Necator americanus]
MTQTARRDLLLDILREQRMRVRGRVEVVGEHIGLVGIGRDVGGWRAEQRGVIRRFRRVARLGRVGHGKSARLEVRNELRDPGVGIDFGYLALQAVRLQRAVQCRIEELRELGQVRAAVGRGDALGRETDVRHVDHHDVCGTRLHDLPDDLCERRGGGLHDRVGTRRVAGAQHVVRAGPDQHELAGVEAAVRGEIARNLLIDRHFDVADHVREEVVLVGRRGDRGAALCVAEAASRAQLVIETDRVRGVQGVPIILRDILGPDLTGVGREPAAVHGARKRRIGPDVGKA